MMRIAAISAARLLAGGVALIVAWDAGAQAPGIQAQVSPQIVPTTPSPSVGTVPSSPSARPAPVPLPVVIEAGSGRLLQLPAPAMTVMAADPRIARVQPASPTSLFIMAVA